MERIAGSRKLPVLVGAGTTATALFYLAFAGTLTPFMLAVWFATFGFLTAYGPLLIAHGKALFPPHQVGRGLTVLNMGSTGGTFLAQAVSGFVIGLFPTGPDGAFALDACRWGVRPAGVPYPIGLSCLFWLDRSHAEPPEPCVWRIDGRATCMEKGQYHLLFLLRFVRCGVSYCGAVAPRVTAALLGRFLPRLGPLFGAALFFPTSREADYSAAAAR